MGTTVGQEPGSASRESEKVIKERLHAAFRSLRNVALKALRLSGELVVHLWRTLPSYLPFYLLVVVVGYAAWQARTPVTTIGPFELPKGDMPFSGETVADALRGGLTSIRVDFERESQKPTLSILAIGSPDLRSMPSKDLHMYIHQFRHVQAPPSFKVEVKGLSPEGIISVARTVMGTETTILGAVILNGSRHEFILAAREADGGQYWISPSSPLTGEGLNFATRELAKHILATEDPTIGGAVLLRDGQVEAALTLLKHAWKSNRRDVRLKLNYCIGLGFSLRYEGAIQCYQEALKMSPSSPHDVEERLAYAYYLSGRREEALNLYDDLAHKQGYRYALLGLAEVLDTYADRRGDAPKAINEFLTAEGHNSDPADVLAIRGRMLSLTGKHDEALAEYRKALQYAPDDVMILTYIGVELAQTGDLDAGIGQLQSVVHSTDADSINADYLPFSLLELGKLLERKGDWQGAIHQFQQATVLRPTYPVAHMRLARALLHEGRRLETFSEFSKIAELSDSQLVRTYSRVFATLWLGNELKDLGNYAAAASAYRQVIRFLPQFGEAHCELGVMLEKQGNIRQAIEEYRMALAMTSGQFNTDSTPCRVLARQQLEAGTREPGTKKR
jgi:tetratricopeptide (TPR) repeat protein